MRHGRAAMLLLLVLTAGCAGVAEQPPHWRRTDPSASEPPLRWQVPDDSFSASLAGAEHPGYGGSHS